MRRDVVEIPDLKHVMVVPNSLRKAVLIELDHFDSWSWLECSHFLKRALIVIPQTVNLTLR